MKHVFLILLSLSTAGAFAQQVLNNAIVKTRVEVSSENTGGDGSGPQIQMPNNETNIKTFLKDSLRKTQTESNAANTITMYDGIKGVTTVLSESMGEKTGYTQSREDLLDQRRRMDSATKAREAEGASGGAVVMRIGGGAGNVVNIDYQDAAKVINKIKCKKAVVTAKKPDGSEHKIDVWYSPDYKMPDGWGKTRLLDLSGIKGLPVMFELANTMNIGGNEITLTTHFEVTSLELNANISEKEFEIPKGYKMKTYAEYVKDNPDGGGGPVMRRTMMRVGG